MIDIQDVSRALGVISQSAVRAWAAPLAAACRERSIDTPERLAAFLAQLAHESQGFRRLEESFAYSAERLHAVFPTRVTAAEARRLVADGPESIANAVYRTANGNRESGDGWRYRGRGLIQLTGRANYREFGLEQHPERAIDPQTAASVAARFWQSRGCNELADANAFTTITRRINGGTNGLGDRKAWWRRFRVALGLTEQPETETLTPARGHEAPTETPPPATGRRIAAGTAGGAAGVTLLDRLNEYLPYTHYLDDVGRFLGEHWRLIVFAAILGAIASLAFYGWRRWQSWKREG